MTVEFHFSGEPWRHDPGAEDQPTKVEHLNGVPWHEARSPFWIHHCRVQTRGVFRNEFLVDRCPCGAMRRNGGRWFGRNATRRRR